MRLSTQTHMARSTYKNTCEVAWNTGPKPKAELHALSVANTVIRKAKEELFMDHANAEHPEFKLDQQVTCLICGTKWPNTWYKEEHMALEHPILWPPPHKEGPIRCHVCLTDWADTVYLDLHMAKDHPEASSQSHQHQPGPSQKPQQSHPPPQHGQHAGHFQGQHHQGGNDSGK